MSSPLILVGLLSAVAGLEAIALIGCGMALRDWRAMYLDAEEDLKQFQASPCPCAGQQPPDPSLVRSAKKVNDEVGRLL